MKSTPFTHKHIALGAKMAEFAGYNMPISYTGINDEHAAVRNSVGVFDVSHMGEFMLKGELALDLMDGNEDVIKLLISKNIIRQNGNLLELDDQFLKFFEEILEVNEEINTSYINESIRQVKDEYMAYYLQASSDSERFKYLKAVKSALRKIGRTTMRNIVDLNRNIDNAFKLEPNYKIKLSKLENLKVKMDAIQLMIVQTEKLLNEEALTFFKTATDEELKYIKTELILELTESRHNLIETRKQIIEYINQIKYQSKFIEK